MDVQSIITQVNNEGATINVPTPTESADGFKIKKHRARNFLSSLFCCFRCKSRSGSHRGSFPDDLSSKQPTSATSNIKASGDSCHLLPPQQARDANKICMVIDLDETLVHSSFKPINNADFVVPVEIEDATHQVYVLKRPHVDEFLQKMGQLYECVLFTASLAKYADPVADLLDHWGVFRARLFRESCTVEHGNYVKDLSKLGRDLRKVVIVDNSPASYACQPNNAVPVASWFQDMSDTELKDLIPFFERLASVENVYNVLKEVPVPSGLPLNYVNSSQQMPLISTSNNSTPSKSSLNSSTITPSLSTNIDLNVRAPENSSTSSVLSPNPPATNIQPANAIYSSSNSNSTSSFSTSQQYLIHSSQSPQPQLLVPNGAS